MIIIIGKNSFISKNLIKSIFKKSNILMFSHQEIHKIKDIKEEKTIFFSCGLNRGTDEELIQGNSVFLEKCLNLLDNVSHFIFISSTQIFGFKNKELNVFAKEKIKCENILKQKYQNLTIIRPSNIFGLTSKPFSNSFLATIIHQTINNQEIKINKNAYRDFIYINDLTNFIKKTIDQKIFGEFNLGYGNKTSFLDICLKINANPIIFDGNLDEPNPINFVDIGEKVNVLDYLDEYLRNYQEDKIEKNNSVEDHRGKLIECSSLNAVRNYYFTINSGFFRGNHYHQVQEEDFTVLKGEVLVILENVKTKSFSIFHLNEGNKINVLPFVKHTFINVSLNTVEIICSSTQKYIPNSIPDTYFE